MIDDTDNKTWLSIASVWEIAVKVSIGKMNLHQPFELFIETQMAINKINLLSLSIPHTAVMSTLPFHHKDPFDRLLIAQAMAEGIPIIIRDAMFDAYSIQRLW